MGHIKINGRKVTNPLAWVLIPFVAATVICALLIATGLVFVVLLLAGGAMLLYAAIRIAVTGPRHFANWNEKRRR